MAQGTTRGVPIDIDPLLTNDSDLLVPSQKAIKTYVDTNTSNAISTKVSRSGDTMSGSLILSGDPTIPFGAATKSYVDTLINGIDWKTAANAATTTALPTYTVSGAGQILTGTVTLGLIDGVTLTANQRILIKNETSTKTPNNGIYVVTQVNPFILTRSSDANTSALLAEATIGVAAGDTLANTQWHCNPATTPIIIGTTYITFAGIGSGTYSFNPPLVDTGSVISIPAASGSVDGYLSSTDWTNFNTAYTSRIATFSVTGNSGAATFSGNTLNIPEYTLSGLGGAGLALDNAFTGSNTFTYNDSDYFATYINNSQVGGGLSISAGAGTSADIRYGDGASSIGIKLYGNASNDGVPLVLYNLSTEVLRFSSAGNITANKFQIYGSPAGFLKANGDIISPSLEFIGSGSAQYQVAVTGAIPFNPIWITSTNIYGSSGLNSLTYTSTSFVKMTGANTFTLDTNTYAGTVSPTFTGTVVLPSTTSIGSVSDSEIAYLDGVTSAIQTQINTAQVYNITITTSGVSPISTDTTSTIGAYSQNGRNVMIDNAAVSTIINVNNGSGSNFIASYTKLGSANITFVAGTGTLTLLSSTAIMSGAIGSTALLTRNGTGVYYLQVNNI